MCRYFAFVNASTQELEPLIWPLGADRDTFDGLSQFNVNLDLIHVDPAARQAAFLLDLLPGGSYRNDDAPGVIELDDLKLGVSIGSQTHLYPSGSIVSDEEVVMFMEDVKPIFYYPFDQYVIVMPVRTNLINASDPNDDLIAAIQGVPFVVSEKL
jgi:hypothetical protein